jgi:hypothetical protein
VRAACWQARPRPGDRDAHQLDGIEETEWAREHAVVGLKFNEWFRPLTRRATACLILSVSIRQTRASGALEMIKKQTRKARR